MNKCYESEGVHFFLIYQAPFKYCLNKKTGMAEGLKIWSGE